MLASLKIHFSLSLSLRVENFLPALVCLHALHIFSDPPRKSVVYNFSPIKLSPSMLSFALEPFHQHFPLSWASARSLSWRRGLFGFRGPLFRLEVRVVVVRRIIMAILES